MNDQSESADSQWFGHDRLRLSDGERAVDVTIGSADHWDRSHLRRLRQSGDLPGMVPVIDSDFSSDGKPFAVTPAIEAPNLAEMIDGGDLDWASGAGITEAAARAAHEAHLRGLFHGALSPQDVYVVDNDVAVGGVGLGLGGTAPEDRAAWTAPEVRGGANPTERSDVFSLGKILEQSLGEALDTAPRSIRRLIMWSSSDTPEARPPSAMEFASILAEGLGDDRRTYGPAFIATGEVSDLAAQAGLAVTRHTPVMAAENADEMSPAGAGVVGTAAGVAAGAAAGAMVSELGDRGGTADGPDIDDGFTVSESAGGAPPSESDPGVEEHETEPDDGADAEVTDVASTDAEAEAETDVASTDAEAEAESDVGAGAEAEPEAEHEVAPVGDAEATDFGDVNPEGELADRFFSDDEPDAAGDDEAEYAVPAAAKTIDYDETYDEAKRRNWAGLVIGGILALGLAGIVFGLLTSDDDVDTAPAVTTATTSDDGGAGTTAATTATTTATTAATTASTAATTTATTTATTAATTATTTATTAATTATTAATTATTTATTAATTTTTTTDDGAGSDDQSSLAPRADGPIAADEAGVQLLHGVPGVPADVYIDGEAIAAAFTSGSIAGPMDLDPGDYDVDLFAATDPPVANSSDRTDTALASGSVSIGAEITSVVAHLDESGNVAVSAFVEDLTDLGPGRSRVNVRHLMGGGTADVLIDGEVLATLDPGQEAAIEVEAGGSTLVEFVGDDGDIIASATVPVNDGELASLSIIGAPADQTAEIVIQRYSGLSTAPVAVPTGNSGLLDVGGDDTGIRTVYGLMIVLALSGVALMLRRRRRLS